MFVKNIWPWWLRRRKDMTTPRGRSGGTIAVCLVVGALFIWPLGAQAGGDYTPVYHPELEVSRAAGPIAIDGSLNDAGWQGAATATNFAEHHPGDQTKPPVDTKAYITYDDAHLYVAMVCDDDPATVRAAFCERDQVFGDDNICLLIDTYGDGAWAYEFNVNPLGIQGDLLWTPNGGEDSGFDLIWESAGRITDTGYQIEMAIPFASLRFPNRFQQIWKVDFWRNHPREIRRQYSWAAYDRDEPCWPCQWGTITGITDVQPGRGLEIIPALVGSQAGTLAGSGTAEDPFDFQNDDPSAEVSMNVKYTLSSTATAEMTINPDFSQVEADPAQIDVNTNFALFYPERRPFFQEGSDLFGSIFNAVYTRSINAPQVAAKLTTRRDRFSLAYLVARDEHTPIILPFEERSEFLLAGESTSNILRARQTFGEDSQIGLLATDQRLDGGGSGTLLSLDGALRLSRPYRFTWQVVGTHTAEPDDSVLTAELEDELFERGQHTAAFDGETYWGYAYYACIARSSRDWGADLGYLERSPTFRAANGFEPRNDQRSLRISGYYTYRTEESPIFESINPEFTAGREWNFDQVQKEEFYCISLAANLRVAQTHVHAHYRGRSERLGGEQFNNLGMWHICSSHILNDKLSLGGYFNYGREIARSDMAIGRELTHGLWLDLRPIDRLLIENWYDRARSRDVDSAAEFYEGYIARSRISLQILRELSLRLVVQYNDFDDCWDIDPLLTYRLNPFSVFHVGATMDIDTYEGLGEDGTGSTHRLSSRQFFLKLQYIFQY
jgi:hypothetical protein